MRPGVWCNCGDPCKVKGCVRGKKKAWIYRWWAKVISCL